MKKETSYKYGEELRHKFDRSTIIDRITELVDEYNNGTGNCFISDEALCASHKIDKILKSDCVNMIESEHSVYAHFALNGQEYEITWHCSTMGRWTAHLTEIKGE